MRRSLTALFALGLLVAVPACSSGDSSSGDSSSKTTASGSGSGSGTEADTSEVDALKQQAGLSGTVNTKGTAIEKVTGDTLEIELDDYYFGPAFIEAAPGKVIHVEIKNEGSATHTFTVDALNIDQELPPGETAEIDVTIPKGAALPSYCRFHKSSGMQGALIATSS